MNKKNKRIMKRILVTGGAGFIGSHLCERLLKDGNDVICLDNYFTGSKDNIRHLIGNDHFELVRHDVTQPYTAEVDEIYNLACPASPGHYQHDPVKTIQTCVIGSMNMLGLAKRVGAKILQASTSEVYGDPNIHPQVEGYWGKARFNLYYLFGIIGTIVAGFIVGYIDNLYLNLSIFLAFATMFPDTQVMLFFIIPKLESEGFYNQSAIIFKVIF